MSEKLLNEKELARGLCTQLCGKCRMEDDWYYEHDNCYTIQEAMSLIKSNCWLKGEQGLPVLYPETFAHGLRLPTENQMKEYEDFMSWLIHEADFKPCKEWEAE
jgi:hypothetical protein